MKEQRWKKQLQKEADEILFEELKFDDRLKAGVRARIEAEKSAGTMPEPDPVGKSGEVEHSQLLKRNRYRRKITGLIVAASLAAVVTFSLSGMFTNPDQDVRVVEGVEDGLGGVGSFEIDDGTTTLMTGTGDPYVPEDGIETGGLFVATGDDGGLDAGLGGGLEPGLDPELDGGLDPGLGGETDGAGSQVMQVELADLHEASELYGEPLALPDYIPDGYEIVRISAAGSNFVQGQFHGEYEISAGNADEIIIEYRAVEFVDGAGSGFVLHIRKQDSGLSLEQPQGEFIELSGKEAIVVSVDSHRELHWILDEDILTLSGDLDTDTMVRIAESIKK